MRLTGDTRTGLDISDRGGTAEMALLRPGPGYERHGKRWAPAGRQGGLSQGSPGGCRT